MDDKLYEHYRLKQDLPVHARQTHLRRRTSLVQVRSGEFTIWIECQKYTLHAGDVAFFAENTLISYEWGVAELDILLIDRAIYKVFPALEAILSSPRYTYGCFLDDGGELITNLHNIMSNAILSTFYLQGCASDIRRTLMAFTDGEYTMIKPESHPFSARQVSHLRMVIKLIESHLSEQMTLEQLAGSIGLSPKYFCRFFQKMTGQSPFTYINCRRIEQACITLVKEKISIKDLAYRVGYHDINYFIKTFKKCCGMTPKRFASAYFGSTVYPWK